MARDEGRDASNLGDLADDGTPVDLAAVRRDDALIESISSGGPVATDSTEQYELALILSQWRDDVVATPMPEGPLLDDVIAAITATPSGFSDRQRSRSRSRLRVVRPIAAAAAVAAVVFGGATAMAYDAQPGDASGASSRSSSPTRPTRRSRRSTRHPSWKRPSVCWPPGTFPRQRWCWTTQLTVPMRSRTRRTRRISSSVGAS